MRRALTGHYLKSELCRDSFKTARAALILGSSSPPHESSVRSSSPMDASPTAMSPGRGPDSSGCSHEGLSPKQHSVSIEDTDDAEDRAEYLGPTIIEEFPGAGKSIGIEKSARKKEWEELILNDTLPCKPFQSLDEWEFSEWLIQSNVSQGAMDKLLKLHWVCEG